MTTYRLTIYAHDATTVIRQTVHPHRGAAVRSVRRYEARHGLAPHAIDALPMPASDDVHGWDDHRRQHGVSAP